MAIPIAVTVRRLLMSVREIKRTREKNSCPGSRGSTAPFSIFHFGSFSVSKGKLHDNSSTWNGSGRRERERDSEFSRGRDGLGILLTMKRIHKLHFFSW